MVKELMVKEAILMITPDEYVYYEIIDPDDFWLSFESLDEWSQAEDYSDYVADGVTSPVYFFGSKATKLHVFVVDG